MDLSLLRLDGGDQTLLLALGEGPPALAYWGPALPPGATVPSALVERAIPHGMLDGGEVLNLFPEAGRGFSGRPALICHRPDGGFITQLRFAGADPILGGHRMRLEDAAAGVAVTISITLEAATGVAAVQTRVQNTGATSLALDWVSPCALPTDHGELLAFGGRWAREFTGHRLALPTGGFVAEGRTGRTSHHAPPYLIVGEPGFGEHQGDVLAIHLAWSGNHRLEAERLRDGRMQLQAGELFLPGEVTLAPGEAYETPWLYAARSSRGLNGLSDRFHPFVREVILGGRLRGKPRPVHFNTWEAVYFRHDLDELKALADAAAKVGAERFVLDDGWFKGRRDDTAGLGDWSADPVKYPHGLGPLIDHVTGLDLEFGLWVEPEMANADSDLLRAHPDWVLGDPARTQPLGRGQYVLDLTRAEVADHLFGALDTVLSAHPIAYLKWDMNRDLTHAVSGGRPAGRRQTQALYALIDRLRAAHPGVEIESCASGGGRADYEILRRTDRIWTSDCNDPLERQAIQRSFSIFFPPEVMGAHVGPAASHTTARTASLDLRAMTALFGHLGVEADIRAFPQADRAALAAAIALHKAHRPVLHGGRLVRQAGGDPGAVAFLVLGLMAEEGEALASYAQLETPRQAAPAPFRLRGLEPEGVYEVRLLNPPARPRASMKRAPSVVLGEAVAASGRLLAQAGLPLPILRAGEVAVFHLRRLEGGS